MGTTWVIRCAGKIARRTRVITTYVGRQVGRHADGVPRYGHVARNACMHARTYARMQERRRRLAAPAAAPAAPAPAAGRRNGQRWAPPWIFLPLPNCPSSGERIVRWPCHQGERFFSDARLAGAGGEALHSTRSTSPRRPSPASRRGVGLLRGYVSDPRDLEHAGSRCSSAAERGSSTRYLVPERPRQACFNRRLRDDRPTICS